MKKKFEKYEASEKPLWNKQAVWENIEGAVLEKERKPYAFGWFKLAAACILLIFGLWFLKDLTFNSTTVVSDHNKPNVIIQNTRDTVYKIVADTEFVIQKKIIRDTIWMSENRIVIHDTFTKIKEVFVEKQREPSQEKPKQDFKPIKKQDSKIIYSFNQPIGEYFPKSQLRFKLFNKEVYPSGSKVQSLVLNR